jgi:hypothetical protein
MATTYSLNPVSPVKPLIHAILHLLSPKKSVNHNSILNLDAIGKYPLFEVDW